MAIKILMKGKTREELLEETIYKCECICGTVFTCKYSDFIEIICFMMYMTTDYDYVINYNDKCFIVDDAAIWHADYTTVGSLDLHDGRELRIEGNISSIEFDSSDGPEDAFELLGCDEQ